VCVNSIIASVLFKFAPDELRFIMVDPKVVEMQMYNRLPHLIVPVVTDPHKVVPALKWVVDEMERRYKIFAKTGVRNFEVFNKRPIPEKKEEQPELPLDAETAGDPGAEPGPSFEGEPDLELIEQIAAELEAGSLGEEQAAPRKKKLVPRKFSEEFIRLHEGDDPDPEELDPSIVGLPDMNDEEEIPDRLPYIVVIIDELADLMQTAPADVEMNIARIAQKARAAGIHLIIATQTPRADVVTGIIKANIPCRIAFQVSSQLDSRVILDVKGAEKLVGKGDMLYLPPGSAKLERAQGSFVSDDEVERLVEYCATQGGEPRFEEGVQESIENHASGGDDEVSDADEEILVRCIEVIRQEQRASTSLLQRRLRLGYTRAARMIDILEQRGLVGPGDGAKPREVFLPPE
jgi:S-DNA-T family DNA segregation ATPase FtsK/SpoIIIE